MEVDAPGTVPGVVAEGATGSASILLHPLVIINMSEHYTRLRMQSGAAPGSEPPGGGRVGVQWGARKRMA